MGKDDWLEAGSGLILGIIGGLALVEIINVLTGRKCPRCNNPTDPNQQYCYNCGNKLKP